VVESVTSMQVNGRPVTESTGTPVGVKVDTVDGLRDGLPVFHTLSTSLASGE
jgi:hypothetical protein